MKTITQIGGFSSRLPRLGNQFLLALRSVADIASAVTNLAPPARGLALITGLALAAESAHAATASWPSRIHNPLTGSTGGSVSLVAEGGYRDPEYLRDEGTEHSGTDLASPTGGAAPVYAVAPGTVKYLRRFDAENYNASCLIIEHNIGSARFYGVYGHTYGDSALREGSTVVAGAKIGNLRKWNSYHLHFGLNLSRALGDFMFGTTHGWGKVPAGTSASQMAALGWRDPIPFLQGINPSSGGSTTADAEGNTQGSAKTLTLNATTPATMSNGDVDFFRINVSSAGELSLGSVGSLDLMAELLDSGGRIVQSDDDGGPSTNFLVRRTVAAGTFFLKVTGYRAQQAGPYGIEASFTRTSSSGGSSSGSGNAASITLVNGTGDLPSDTVLGLSSLQVGQRSQLSLKLRNSGSDTATVTGVSLSSRDLRPRGAAPSSIRAGSTATLPLDLIPSTTGTQTWRVRVSFSNAAPFTIYLRGNVR